MGQSSRPPIRSPLHIDGNDLHDPPVHPVLTHRFLTSTSHLNDTVAQLSVWQFPHLTAGASAREVPSGASRHFEPTTRRVLMRKERVRSRSCSCRHQHAKSDKARQTHNRYLKTSAMASSGRAFAAFPSTAALASAAVGPAGLDDARGGARQAVVQSNTTVSTRIQNRETRIISGGP